MTEEQKRQYEAVFSWLSGVMDMDETCTEELCTQWSSDCGRCIAHKILSDPRIRILDKDQEWIEPTDIATPQDAKGKTKNQWFLDGQVLMYERMRRTNFMRVIPKEKE